MVAIAGGPGAGKTAIIELARRTLCHHVAFLPEAAGIIFSGGFPRREDPEVRGSSQRAIFHVQRELEGLGQLHDDVAFAVCDRGTIDGVAYWPGDPSEYWAELGATYEAELARYRAVIHLRTPSPSNGYNHDNELRIETPAEARAIDERILAAWAPHPRQFVIEATESFEAKAARAIALLRAELALCT